MADYVVNAVFQDNISQGAKAAADALNTAATAADTVTTAVTKTTASANALAARYDPLTQSTNALARAQQQLSTAQTTLSAGVAAGKITQDQANGSLDTLQAKVLAAQKAVAATSPVLDAVTASTGNTAYALRNLGVEGTRAITDIASGTPVLMTFMATGRRVGDVMTETGVGFRALGTAVLGLLSPTVLVVAGVAAVGAAIYEMGSSAEHSQAQMIALQNQLRATRDDYVSMASEVQAAARGAVTGSFTGTQTLTAGQTIAAQPNFQGTQQQLQSLIQTAENMALVFNETLPAAAQTLAKSMQDPGSVAEDLATKHFPAMSQALADSVVQMQNAGDRAGAFNTVIQALNTGTAGATQHLTPLQQAMQNLDDAFKRTDGDGKSFVQTLGTGMADAAAIAVNSLASVTAGIEQMYEAATRHASGSTSIQTPDITASPGDTSMQQPLLGPVQKDGQQAVGLFQINPATASSMGFSASDIATTGGNIAAAFSYLLELAVKNGGNQSQILAQYGGFGSDVAAAQGYIAKVQGADVSTLPQSIQQQITQYGTQRGIPFNTTDLAERLAVVESGGRQFGTSASATAPITFVPPIPPAGADTQNGFVTANPMADADNIAASLGLGGKDGSTIQQLNAQALTLGDALQTLGSKTAANAQEYDKLSTALDTVHQRMIDAATPLQKLINSTDDQTQANEAMAAAYLQGGDAVQQLVIQQKAQADLLEAHITPTMANYADALATAIGQESKLAQSAQDVALAQQTASNDNQLQYIQAETDSLGMNNDQRTVMLAALQEEIKLKNQGIDVTTQAAQADIQSAGAIAQATASYTDQKEALDGLAQSFSSAFDTIGNAITQAFVQGQGAAVNWKNVMDSVIEQVLQKALQLAVLNPLLNSINPTGNLPTLGSAFSALETALGGSSSTGSSSSFGAGTVLQVGSLANTASGGGILNSLGLGNLGSSISGFLSTPLIGGFTSADVAAAGSMSPTALIAAQDAATTGGAATGASLTVGGLLSGAGLGFGAGSLLDSLLGAKNPTVGTIGSGVGGLAGAALGSLLGPAGTLLGGLFGGPIGGARGFISKGKAA